jgi:hypothetical protein
LGGERDEEQAAYDNGWADLEARWSDPSYGEGGGPATEADAHREWHLNAGVPVGQPCPWDACDPAEEYEGEA